MTQSPRDTAQALALFDALCALRPRDVIDDKLAGDIVDALAVSGRAAELMTRFIAPVRTSVLAKMASDSWTGTVGESIPAGVLEIIVTLLPQLPPLPRKEVETIIGAPGVRAEVRRLLEETVSELLGKLTGGNLSKGVLGWGARAAGAAGRGLFGALGGVLGADVESRIGDAVEFGVGLAQKRIVDLVSSPETARRVGKEIAVVLPRLTDVKDSAIATALQRPPHALIDGLVASVIAHNAGRPVVRALAVDETRRAVDRLSHGTIGDLLDKLGLKEPLRTATERMGGAVVAAIRTRIPA